MEKNGDYAIVTHDKVEALLAQGWTVANTMAGAHHGHWSIIMKAPESKA